MFRHINKQNVLKYSNINIVKDIEKIFRKNAFK
jgi:hypothetical protein